MHCYCNQGKDDNFFSLKGKTIVKLDLICNEVYIETSDGKKYVITHFQDCCENVRHEKTKGDVCDVLNSPITLAEEDHPGDDPKWWKGSSMCGTWSAYYLETENGRLEIWFLGESNGYYSETMSFVEVCQKCNNL